MTTGTPLTGDYFRELRAQIGRMEERLRAIEASLHRWGERLDHRSQRQLGEVYGAIEALLRLHREYPAGFALPPLSSPFSGWAITPQLASFIAQQIRRRGPELVVEAGSGSSTIIIGALLKSRGRGRCVSLEHDAVWYTYSVEQIEVLGLGDWVEVRFAPLEEVEIGDEVYWWYERRALKDLDGVELVLVDGPPGASGELSRFPLVPLLRDRLVPGALIILDDVTRKEEQETVARWISEWGLLKVGEEVWGNKGAAFLQTDGGGSL